MMIEKKEQEIKTEEVLYESEVKLEKALQWKTQRARLKPSLLEVQGKKVLPICELIKLKCLKQEVEGRFRKIKLTNKAQDEFFIAAEVDRIEDGLPLQYGWFSSLANAKLLSYGVSLDKTSFFEGKDLQVPVAKVFTKGYVFKRSKFLKKWEVRYTVINAEGLFSFKSAGEQASFVVRREDLKYVWTRFDTHNGNLVVKLRHGMEKTEFAVPIMNFRLRSAQNWLLGFYRLLVDKHIELNS